MNRTHFKQKLHGLGDTARLAQAVATALQGGEVLALEGDLGAGKTSFTRELTRALGCSRLANSPTFSLFQRYKGGRLPVLHGDFYRLNSAAELDDLGWDEILHEQSKGLTVIEWANRFPNSMPSDHLRMVWHLQAEEEDREVELFASGPLSEKVLHEVAS